MNKIEIKEIAPDAARLFEEEVRGLKPDISRNALCDLLNDYIFYRTDDMGKEESRAIVDVTCRSGAKKS